MTDGKLTVDGRIHSAEVLLYGRGRDQPYGLKSFLARQDAFLQHCTSITHRGRKIVEESSTSRTVWHDFH